MKPTISTFASEPDRFGRAFFIAIAIEVLAVAAFMFAPKAPTTAPPAVVQIHVMQPAPVPVAKPPPPVPLPPTPPVPTPPVPVAPPLPMPPLPPLRPTDHPVHTRHVVRPPPPPPNSPPPEPAPPAPVTAAPAVSNTATLTLISRYEGEIHAIVLSHLVVPAQLIQTGLSGTCVLRFTLSPGGDILAVSVITPSGIHDVNEAALQALRASRFPAFLAGMPQKNHEFELSVHVSGQDQ